MEEHDSVKRGSIHVVLSTVSIYTKTMTIHIDSGTTIYRLKAQERDEYLIWLNALRCCRAAHLNAEQNSGILVDGSWLLADSKYELDSTHIHGGIPQDHHATVIQELSRLSHELNILQEIVEEMRPPIFRSGSAISNTKIPDSTPPTSPAVPKKRFILKRGTSHTSSGTNLESIGTIESGHCRQAPWDTKIFWNIATALVQPTNNSALIGKSMAPIHHH